MTFLRAISIKHECTQILIQVNVQYVQVSTVNVTVIKTSLFPPISDNSDIYMYNVCTYFSMQYNSYLAKHLHVYFHVILV